MARYLAIQPRQLETEISTPTLRERILCHLRRFWSEGKKFACPMCYDYQKLAREEYEKIIKKRKRIACSTAIAGTVLLIIIFLIVTLTTSDKRYPSKSAILLAAIGGPVVFIFYICCLLFAVQRRRPRTKKRLPHLDSYILDIPNFSSRRIRSYPRPPEDLEALFDIRSWSWVDNAESPTCSTASDLYDDCLPMHKARRAYSCPVNMHYEELEEGLMPAASSSVQKKGGLSDPRNEAKRALFSNRQPSGETSSGNDRHKEKDPPFSRKVIDYYTDKIEVIRRKPSLERIVGRFHVTRCTTFPPSPSKKKFVSNRRKVYRIVT